MRLITSKAEAMKNVDITFIPNSYESDEFDDRSSLIQLMICVTEIGLKNIKNNLCNNYKEVNYGQVA